MTQDYLVYTIIATYNGEHWIKKCLDSLQQSDQRTKVIVIDNGSKDETLRIITGNYPEIQVITTGKNLGFGQANNVGLRIALQNNADYVFLLNQDAWVERNTISQLIAEHLNDTQLGIISPIHLNGAGSDFDPIFYQYFAASDIHDMVREIVLPGNFTTNVVNTQFVNAAAWLISKACLIKTGGFDPIFYHYGEDNNFAHRVLYNGFKIGVVCSAKAYHDKHYSLAEKETNDKYNFKHDRIIFLHQACDIQNNAFKTLFLKRLCRYLAFGALGIITINKKSISYNFLMTKTILQSFKAVSASRKATLENRTPYLI